jgi:hypothetical protein
MAAGSRFDRPDGASPRYGRVWSCDEPEPPVPLVPPVPSGLPIVPRSEPPLVPPGVVPVPPGVEPVSFIPPVSGRRVPGAPLVSEPPEVPLGLGPMPPPVSPGEVLEPDVPDGDGAVLDPEDPVAPDGAPAAWAITA